MSVDYKIELKKLVSALQVEAKSHHKNRDFLQLLPFNPEKQESYDLYTMNSPFSLTIIDYTPDAPYLFAFIGVETAFSIAVDTRQLSRLHKHDYFELFYILDGHLDIMIEGSHHRYESGEACLINCNARHVEEYRSAFLAVYLNFSPQYLSALTKHLFLDTQKDGLPWFLSQNIQADQKDRKDYIDFTPMPAPDEGISNGMEQLIYRIVSESKGKAPGYEDIVSGSLKRLLFHLQSPIEYTHSYVRLKAIREQNLFEDTVTYINLQKRKVSRSELADALNYNGDYISQIFYKQTGQTLADYIRNVCLREAASLLLNTDLSASAIIHRLGFENRTAFYRQFKKKYQVTLDEYRHNYRNF